MVGVISEPEEFSELGHRQEMLEEAESGLCHGQWNLWFCIMTDHLELVVKFPESEKGNVWTNCRTASWSWNRKFLGLLACMEKKKKKHEIEFVMVKWVGEKK